MISVVERHPNQVEAELVRARQCVSDKSALACTVAAEHMRAMIYGSSVTRWAANATQTVHTTRLVTAARRPTELMWPRRAARVTSAEARPEPAEVCSTMLEYMEMIGDAADMGGGNWIAAPLRIISPTDSSNCLLVGAIPAAAVHTRLGSAPVCAAASRFISSRVLTTEDNIEFSQTIDDWLGERPPLSLWTSDILASHEARMEVVQELSAEQLEIYAPDVARAQRRAGSWVPGGHIVRQLDGTRLCRPQSRYARNFDRPYYVARFDYRQGGLMLRQCALIDRDLSLRLRFGLDISLSTRGN